MVDYSPSDWENIPPIIPSSFAHFTRELGSIQDWIKVKESEESIASILFKIQNLERQLKKNTEETTDLIKDQVTVVNEKIKVVTRDVEKLKEKPKIKEAVMQTEITSKDFEQNPDIVIEEQSEDEESQFLDYQESGSPRKSGLEQQTPRGLLNRMSFGEDKKKENSEPDMVKPRMYSLGLLKKIVYKYINRSQLKLRINKHEHQIKQLTNTTEDTYDKLETTVADFGLEIQRVHEKIDFYKDSLDKICKEVEEKLVYINKWSEKVEEKFKEYQSAQDELKIKNQELLEDYDVIKQFNKKVEDKISENTKELKAHTKKKLETLAKNLRKENVKIAEIFDEKLGTVVVRIDSIRDEIGTQFLTKIEEVNDKQTANFKEAIEEVEQQIADYKKIQESDLERFMQEFAEDKAENHDHHKRVQLEMKKMRTDFDRWVANVMEPAHVAEARIFAIEARVKEEEVARMENLHFVNDIIKKLIFSFEQAQANVLAPALRPPSRNDSDANLTLLMKRLAFLKKIIQFNGEPTPPPTQKTGKPNKRTPSLNGRDRVSFSAMDENSSFVTEKPMRRESYTSSPMRISSS